MIEYIVNKDMEPLWWRDG